MNASFFEEDGHRHRERESKERSILHIVNSLENILLNCGFYFSSHNHKYSFFNNKYKDNEHALYFIDFWY